MPLRITPCHGPLSASSLDARDTPAKAKVDSSANIVHFFIASSIGKKPSADPIAEAADKFPRGPSGNNETALRVTRAGRPEDVMRADPAYGRRGQGTGHPAERSRGAPPPREPCVQRD